MSLPHSRGVAGNEASLRSSAPPASLPSLSRALSRSVTKCINQWAMAGKTAAKHRAWQVQIGNGILLLGAATALMDSPGAARDASWQWPRNGFIAIDRQRSPPSTFPPVPQLAPAEGTPNAPQFSRALQPVSPSQFLSPPPLWFSAKKWSIRKSSPLNPTPRVDADAPTTAAQGNAHGNAHGNAQGNATAASPSPGVGGPSPAGSNRGRKRGLGTATIRMRSDASDPEPNDLPPGWRAVLTPSSPANMSAWSTVPTLEHIAGEEGARCPHAHPFRCILR